VNRRYQFFSEGFVLGFFFWLLRFSLRGLYSEVRALSQGSRGKSTGIFYFFWGQI
jgi:hypothetical protein